MPATSTSSSQLAATEDLIQTRQAEHRQRTGAEMGHGHIWLTERMTESLAGVDHRRAQAGRRGAIRGAGVPARSGQPVPITISDNPRRPRSCQLSRTRSRRCARPRRPTRPPSPAPKPGSASSSSPVSSQLPRGRRGRRGIGGLSLPSPRPAGAYRTAPLPPARTLSTTAIPRPCRPSVVVTLTARLAEPAARSPNQGPARRRARRAAYAAQAPRARRSRRLTQPPLPAVRHDATLKTRHQRHDLAIHASEAGQGQITRAQGDHVRGIMPNSA